MATLLLLGASTRAEDQRLPVDRPLVVVLSETDEIAAGSRGSARTLVVTPSVDGPLTLRAVSAQGDVFLRVFGERGEVVIADDDGGWGSNACLELAAVGGGSIRLEAGFKARRDGALVLQAIPGEEPERDVDGRRVESRMLSELGRFLEAEGSVHSAMFAYMACGQSLFELQDLALARRALSSGLAMAEEVGHAIAEAYANAYLGAVEALVGELSSARTHLTSALDAAEELGMPDIQLFASSHLGDVELHLDRFDEAEAHMSRALELSRRLGDVANEASIHGQLAEVFVERGDHEGARRWLTRMTELVEGLDRPELRAQALLSSARYHTARGELGLAEQRHREALELATTPRLRAVLDGALGLVLWHRGDFSGALQRLEAQLDSARRLGDRELEQEASSNLGLVSSELGDHAAARRLFERAAELLGNDRPADRSAVLMNIAWVDFAAGQPRRARDTLEEALSLAQLAGDGELEVWILSAIIHDHYQRSEFALGLELAQRQLQLARGEGPLVRKIGLSNRAELLLKLGRVAEALAPAREASAICRRTSSYRRLLDALATEVEVVIALGDLETATAIIDEAESLVHRAEFDLLDDDVATRLRSRHRYALWSEFHQDLVALKLERWDQGERDGDARRSIVADGFRKIGLWKGRALLEGIAEHRRGVRNARTMGLRTERARLLADRQGMLEQVNRAIEEGEELTRIDALRDRAEALDRSAAELTAQLRDIAPADVDLDLPLGVSPESVWTEVLQGSGRFLEYAEGRSRLYVYSIDGDGPRLHDLGARTQLETLVDSFVAKVADPLRSAGATEIADAGRELYGRLLAPVLDDAATRDRKLIIAPTASLARLPFDALVVESPPRPASFSELTFVIDRFDVSYGATPSVLMLLASEPPRPRRGAVLVLADPVYPTESPGSDTSTRGVVRQGAFERLVGTRREGLAIARLALEGSADDASVDATLAELAALEDERSGTVASPSVVIHVGEEARPSALRGDRRRFAIIHLAAHGYVDTDDPRLSGLALSAGPDESGHLSLADVLELDLDADLAVLSACETAQGKAMRGEGVQSLARAFIYAGARSVVASLWKVDDTAAVETMAAFYAEYLQRGLEPAESLRVARQRVRTGHGARSSQERGVRLVDGPTSAERRGHPFDWAPFIFIGLPR